MIGMKGKIFEILKTGELVFVEDQEIQRMKDRWIDGRPLLSDGSMDDLQTFETASLVPSVLPNPKMVMKLVIDHLEYRPDEVGVLFGVCNRGACESGVATWFNHSTKKFYCAKCAALINEANKNDEFVKKLGHPLCTPGAPEEV